MKHTAKTTGSTIWNEKTGMGVVYAGRKRIWVDNSGRDKKIKPKVEREIMRKILSDEIKDLELFKKEYHKNGNKFMAQKYGVTSGAISGFAKRHGFSFSPKQAKAMARKNRKDIKL